MNSSIEIFYSDNSVINKIPQIFSLEDEILADALLSSEKKLRLLLFISIQKFGVFTLENEGVFLDDVYYQINADPTPYEVCFNMCVSQKMASMTNFEKVVFTLGLPWSWVAILAECTIGCGYNSNYHNSGQFIE